MFQYSASGDARGLTRFTPSPDGANRPPTRRTRPRAPVHPVPRRGEPARIEENSALQRGRLDPDPSRPWRQTCLPGSWFLWDLGDDVSSDCLGRGRKRRNRFIDGVCRGGSVAIDGVADDGGPAKRARALRGVIREVHDSVRKVGEGAGASRAHDLRDDRLGVDNAWAEHKGRRDRGEKDEVLEQPMGLEGDVRGDRRLDGTASKVSP